MDEKIKPDTIRSHFLTDSLLTTSKVDQAAASKTKEIIYPIIGILVVALLLVVLFNNRSH